MSKVVIKEARLAFPSLWETETYNGQDTGKYTATFLVPKDSKQGKEIAKKVAEEMKAVGAKKGNTPLRDGDDVEYDGFAGNYALKASTKKRPVVIDRKKTPLTDDDDVIYAGCFVNASVDISGYENSYGKRVGCMLNAVQFVKDGDPFGGATGGSDDFDDLGDLGEDDNDEEDNPF